MRKIVLASTNSHKVREFQDLLAFYGMKLIGFSLELPVPEETGNWFQQNADIKASYYSGFVDDLVLADDSGLCVDALKGEPGVYSARYAGPGSSDRQNNEKLLEKLQGKPKRTASFVCCLSLARGGEILLRSEGKASGIILEQIKGNLGFGYDPLFYFPPLKKTFAEMSAEEKNQVSHRALALKNMATLIVRTLDTSNN